MLLCVEHGKQRLLAAIPEAGAEKDQLYDYLTSVERRKSDQETPRLLYVAATRARRGLHLLGSVKVKDDGSIGEPKSDTFLKLLWPAVGEQFANPVRRGDVHEVARPGPSDGYPHIGAFPRLLPTVVWDGPEIEREQRPEAAFAWASDRSRFIGDALHGFLQRIAREGLDAWNETSLRSRHAAYRAVLANLGVSPADLGWAIDRVEAGIARTLRDPAGDGVFKITRTRRASCRSQVGSAGNLSRP